MVKPQLNVSIQVEGLDMADCETDSPGGRSKAMMMRMKMPVLRYPEPLEI